MKSQAVAMRSSSRPSSRRKRAAVLAAAEEAFLGARYDVVTMDDIADAAGVSKQTLYAYFGTKDQLFVALVTAMTSGTADAVIADAPATLPDGQDLETHLVALLRRQLAGVLQPRMLRLRRMVIGEVHRFPELARAVYEHGPQRAVDTLTELLGDAHARGLLDVPDPRRSAIQLNWLVMGEPVNRAMFLGDDATPAAHEARTHVETAVRTFLRAHRPTSEPVILHR